MTGRARAGREAIRTIKERLDLKKKIAELEKKINDLENKPNPTSSDETRLSKFYTEKRILEGKSRPATTTRQTPIGYKIPTTGRTTPANEKAIGSAPGTRGTRADALTPSSTAPKTRERARERGDDYQGSSARFSQEKRAPLSDIRRKYDDLTPRARQAELKKYFEGKDTEFKDVIEQRNSKETDFDKVVKQLTNRNKGGMIKKSYMGGGMAYGKKHNYVAGGYVTDMMGKKKK